MLNKIVDKMLLKKRPVIYIIFYITLVILYYFSLAYVIVSILTLIWIFFSGETSIEISRSFAIGILIHFPVRYLKHQIETANS